MMAVSEVKISDMIRRLTIPAPDPVEYHVSLETDKQRIRFIDRVEKIIRSSLEYKDYINFLKEHMDLNKCAFYQRVCQEKKNNRSRISIELHHEPFTLFDYVATVLDKFIYEGREPDMLLIADEVLELHYSNKVGLIPLSKTIHQVYHNSSKLKIPLNMVYGDYATFLSEYESYDYADILYDKLERKIRETKNLTEEDFESFKVNYTYINVPQYDAVEKMDVRQKEKDVV